MKIICKLAWKNVSNNPRRTIFTLLCVILSVSIISAVLGIRDSLLCGIDFNGDESGENMTRWICGIFTAVSCFMSCFTICTVFSISLNDRIKGYGFLTSIGMSVPQRFALILLEAVIYGIIGTLFGTLLGVTLSSFFYGTVSNTLFREEGIFIGHFVLSFPSMFLSVLLGLLTVLVASFWPAFRMRHLSVTETIKNNSQINISLKQTFLSRIAEKLFGRLGLLAGQNYDNNKGKYRSISLALSGGTVFYISLYSFFKYPFWYESDLGRGGWDNLDSGAKYLFYSSQFLAAFFVFVFLFCSAGALHQNLDRRKKEFATYRSMGMQSSELRKMMSIEGLFLTWYSVLFGFLGAFAGDCAVFVFFRIIGPSDLKFHFPIAVFCIFILIDITAGIFFSLYSCHKVSRVNIIETIRNDQ